MQWFFWSCVWIHLLLWIWQWSTWWLWSTTSMLLNLFWLRLFLQEAFISKEITMCKKKKQKQKLTDKTKCGRLVTVCCPNCWHVTVASFRCFIYLILQTLFLQNNYKLKLQTCISGQVNTEELTRRVGILISTI